MQEFVKADAPVVADPRALSSDYQRSLAETCFEQYDFGEDVVVDTGTWTFDGDNVWSRTVFIENAENPEQDSIKKTFTVAVTSPTTADCYFR